MSIQHTDIAIIGSGFGGIGIAIQLQHAGMHNIVLLEKASDVGGCWRDNSYPGAACDVPSHLYSFSFEPKFDWSRKFAPQREIYAYIRHCAEKYHILPKVQFNTEVTAARFDEQQGVWFITTNTGKTISARVLISACGQLNRPAYPRLKGIESFKGEVFHSATWNHNYNLNNKTVAVVGTGASAIQFVPEIGKQVKKLSLFQRSAPYVIPKPDRSYSSWEHALYEKLPTLQTLSRAAMYTHHESRALAMTVFKSALKPFEWQFQRHLHKAIKDPVLRAKLTPDYPLGCKRILISNEYYETLARPNVDVVTDNIAEVTATGIRTKDGQEHPVDAIIYGTGFQATDFLAPMKITGRDGVDLNQVWRDGAEAYLGMTVSGFPNLFLLYGPNTNLGHNSIVYMLESQFSYILDAVKTLQQRDLRFVDVRSQVQGVYNRWVQKQIKNTIWDAGCTSWYKTASGKNTNNWPGFTLAYRYKTRHFDSQDYELAVKSECVVPLQVVAA